MIPSAPALSAVLALLVKVTLVIAAAGLVTAALGRRASAATRHLVWLVAVVAVLALPLLGAVLPA